MLQPTSRDQRFVEFLCRLADETGGGALTVLRRTAGKPPGAAPERLRWLAPWTADLSRRLAAVYLQGAALFALHPRHVPGGNLGTTAAALRRTGSAGLEQRFVALLACRAENLGYHLRRWVNLAAHAGVPLDWAQLLVDWRHWDHPDQFVQMAWAEAFWREEFRPGAPAAVGAATGLDPGGGL
jgi:CRISPR type I-E-associated protein CasB/Cse2